MSEPEMPVPAPQTHAEEQEWFPVCPKCNGLMRRDLEEPVETLRCDLHGGVRPKWIRKEVE